MVTEVLICHSENLRALRNCAKPILPVLHKWNNKAWMTAYLFTTWFTKYLKPTVQTYSSEKKIPLKVILLIDVVPSHPRALVMYSKVNVVFMPADTTSILQPMEQGVIFNFDFFVLLLKKHISWGAWVAPSVKRPTSAPVTISRSVSSSPASGSGLMAQSLELASDSVSPSLSAPPPFMLCLSLSQK